MQNNNNFSKVVLANIRVFGSLRVLISSALFVALSIVFGKFLSLNPTTFLRIGVENLPILMGGIFFGPFVGALIGATADIIGCLWAGYTINPIITVGAVSIGFISGLVSQMLKGRKLTFNVVVSTMTAHIIGSMIIKSVGMNIFFGIPYLSLLLRIPLYICIGFVEFNIILLLLKNREFSRQISKMKSKTVFRSRTN